jgi:FixJ family two-component response regulator
MLDAAATAVEPDRKRRASEKVRSDLRALFETLSPCECEVMALVSSGLMNEQIAAELNLAEIAIEFHRGRIMKKPHARSVADLVKMAEAIGMRCTNQK